MTSLSSNRINQIVGNSYDQSGNQLTVNGNTLADKFENHVVSDTHGASQAVESYVYDGPRSRVEKYEPGRTPRTVFVYDMGRVAAEYNSMATMPPVTTCYLSDDHLGTPRLITDSHGRVAARHDYLPFGEELAASTFGRNQTYGPGSEGLEHFTGKERDSGSGLDYFRARYYGSALGRFTSLDWSAKDAAKAVFATGLLLVHDANVRADYIATAEGDLNDKVESSPVRAFAKVNGSGGAIRHRSRDSCNSRRSRAKAFLKV